MDQPMSVSELYERGFVLMQLRMFHPAIDDFQTAARDSQYAGKAYVPMALCLRAIGQHEEAVAALRQAITSPMVSPVEQRHILYHLGHMLESLGRRAESLEVYGWISKGDPGFRDVAQRIKYLSSGKRGLYSWALDRWRALMNRVSPRRRAWPPHMQTVLDGTEQWLGWPAETRTHPGGHEIGSSLSSDEAAGTYVQSGSQSRRISGQDKLAS
jgi:tetratricopeptide (TPR) repeat protein